MRFDARFGLASRVLIAAGALTVLLAAGGSPASARPGLPTIVQDDRQFLHRSPEQVRQAMSEARALGIDRVRLTASWSSLTRDARSERRPQFDASDPAAYEQDRWRALDVAVRSAGDAGLLVMIDVGFWAPSWAASGEPPRVRSDIDPIEFAQFATAVARRYSGSFVPPPGSDSAPSPPSPALPRADIFTLWNEPNHPAFLTPQWTVRHGIRLPASPSVYRPMVTLGYRAIKASRPDATVLIGNTSSVGGSRARDPVPPLRFLRALACVDRHFRALRTPDCAAFQTLPGDGWAHHPYSLKGTPAKRAQPGHRDDVYLGNLGSLARTLDRLVALHRLAPGMRSIYLTEFGYETHRLADRPALSEANQARYLTWGEFLASRLPAVKLFGQFLLRDQPPAATIQSDSPRRPYGQFYTGLEHVDGSPKLAVRSFVAGLFVKRTSAGRILLWGRLRVGDRLCSIVLQRRLPGHRWKRLATARQRGAPRAGGFRVPGRASFLRYTTAAPGARYRLLYRPDGAAWVASLPVFPVGRRRH